ncbi:hypothetical protein LSH36_718g01023 [Paralvinella palmiformis]|uniref:Ig-like domain-containing protein n=1 Tax=Paralvinella palmiformis TaxID=53620 RepID=A0AAD9J236_9ANNE|nr:hypothetical protein LSH36_718g01023 [Paralvinella palmiformis]
MGYVDSANYSCEVKAPRSRLLGIVRYTVFVKAPVKELLIIVGNTTSIVDFTTVATVTMVENQPTPVRCVARGGSPPPDMKITLGRADYTKYFRLDTMPALSGTDSFRTLLMTTILVTEQFRVTTRDDDKRISCIAQVPGLARIVQSARIIVNYAPRITCKSTTAYIGDRNVRITCDVIARPPVTSWFWILDDNGTTISEGDVIDGYWTIVTNRQDKKHLQLYFRETKETTFRRYTLVVTNIVAKRTAEVPLKRRT